MAVVSYMTYENDKLREQVDALTARVAELDEALRDAANAIAEMASAFHDAVGPHSVGLALLRAADSKARAALRGKP